MATRKASGVAGGEGTQKQPARGTRGRAAQADGASGSTGGAVAAAGTGAGAADTGAQATSGNGGTKASRGAGAKAGTGGRARSAGGPGGSGAKQGGGGDRAGGARSKGPDLRADLRDFASGRPDGWNHEDWLGFLEHLQSRGHNINDRDAIGQMLEKERVVIRLQGVEGLSSQKARALADRYGNIWTLRHADADELARDAKLPREVAERVLESARQ